MSLFYPRSTYTPTQRYGYGLNPFGAQSWHGGNDFAPLMNLFNETFNHFDNLARELDTATGRQGGTAGLRALSASTFSPKFDVKETKESYLLEGEVPGVKKGDLDIEFVDDSTLTIKGRTESTREEGVRPKMLEAAKQQATIEASGALPAEDAAKSDTSNSNELGAVDSQQKRGKTDESTYWLSERTSGSFSRSFSFPAEVKHDAIRASLKDGILKMVIPKVVKEEQAPKTRKVEVHDVTENEEMNV